MKFDGALHSMGKLQKASALKFGIVCIVVTGVVKPLPPSQSIADIKNF